MKQISISGVIGWDATAADLRKELQAANGDAVELVISSPGGLVSEGLEMFNMIRNYPGQTTARLSGYAMSMASYIPLAAKRIVAEDNAIYMIHNVRGGVFGDHNDILNYGATTKGMSRLIAKAYATRTGKALDEVEKMMDAETYFFGDEMTDHGFVDEIITTDSEKDIETAKATACVALQECTSRMASDIIAVKNDLAAAAVMIGSMAAQPYSTSAASQSKETTIMTIEELKGSNHDLYQAVLDEGKAVGAQAERDRIAEVRALATPGHEALVEQMAFDGKSTGADVALAIVAAEKALRAAAEKSIIDEAPPVVPPADSGDSAQAITRAQFQALSPYDRAAYAKSGKKIVE